MYGVYNVHNVYHSGFVTCCTYNDYLFIFPAPQGQQKHYSVHLS